MVLPQSNTDNNVINYVIVTINNNYYLLCKVIISIVIFQGKNLPCKLLTRISFIFLWKGAVCFFFWLHWKVCGILFPWPRIKPGPLAENTKSQPLDCQGIPKSSSSIIFNVFNNLNCASQPWLNIGTLEELKNYGCLPEM